MHRLFADFRWRIERDDVDVCATNKKPETDLSAYWKLFEIICVLRPNILHTQNIAAVDALYPARIAGVMRRIHGEHGWDVNDLKGENKKFRLLRRIQAPLISEYVALSRDLENYLIKKVGIRRKKIRQIYNGVDVDKFRPTVDRVAVRRKLIPDFPGNVIVIGTIGWIQPVKDHANLADAFIRLIERSPELAERVRLAIVAYGELPVSIERLPRDTGVGNSCWMPGRPQ